MRQVDIACLLIKQRDKFFLQHRNGDPKIGSAGTYGLFGGKINEGEDPKVAAIREVGEETNLSLKHVKVEPLGRVKVNSDHQNEPVKVVGDIFQVEVDRSKKIEAREGELIILTEDEIKSQVDKLSAITKATFEELLWR